jgi:hypothetical protein
LGRNFISRQDLGTETHNVWLDAGLVHVCSSSDYSILREDRQEYPLVRHAWARGYCIQGDRRFVGASENLTRANRSFSDCNVLELGNNYKYIGAVWLRGFGMLHDLRSIDLPDSTSHNGQIFDLKRSGLDQRFLKHTLSRSVGRLR